MTRQTEHEASSNTGNYKAIFNLPLFILTQNFPESAHKDSTIIPRPEGKLEFVQIVKLADKSSLWGRNTVRLTIIGKRVRNPRNWGVGELG